MGSQLLSIAEVQYHPAWIRTVRLPAERIILLPKKHIDWFQSKMFRGKLLDINDYTMEVDPMVHWILHGKGKHFMKWVDRWGLIRAAKPDASADEIFEELYVMMHDYGILP